MPQCSNESGIGANTEEPRQKVWDKPSVRRLLFFARLQNDDEVGLAVAVVLVGVVAILVAVAFKEGAEVEVSAGVTEVEASVVVQEASLREAGVVVGALAEEPRQVLQGTTLRGRTGLARANAGTSSIYGKNSKSQINRSIENLSALVEF
jgi:hypothetical protein